MNKDVYDEYYKVCEHCKWYRYEPGHESYDGRCLHPKHNGLVVFARTDYCEDWKDWEED
jgi:hypothetical protein